LPVFNMSGTMVCQDLRLGGRSFDLRFRADLITRCVFGRGINNISHNVVRVNPEQVGIYADNLQLKSHTLS